MLFAQIPVSALADGGFYAETDAERVTVMATISNDGTPIMGNDADETVLANLEVSVPYFDLDLYGLSDYYRYGTEDGSGPYVNNKLIERPTVLHLYIYMLERYYMGIPEDECGKGTSGVMDYNENTQINYLDGAEAYKSNEKKALYLSPMGSPTSLYMGNFWGHDENLMYYVNHAYPLMSPGWGSTCDYVLLSDGDTVDVGMFTDWSFWTAGAFACFSEDVYTAVAGETVTTQTWETGTHSVGAGDPGERKPITGLTVGVYNSEWQRIATLTGTENTYSYTFEAPGTYYLLAEETEARTEEACVAPAVSKIIVRSADAPDRRLTVTSGTAEKERYAAGELVIITANKAPEGQVFDKWTTEDGITFADANTASTSFTMPERDVTVVATYKDIIETPQVNRIAGGDRYDTSAKTALDAYPDGAETVIIARGDDEGNFADGLAASYLAGVKNAPVLLTSPGSLPDSVEKAIQTLKAKNAIVLGGTLAVSANAETELKALGLTVKRLSGANRYDTAAKIAAEGGNAETAIVVSGFAPADSLVAGPLAFSEGYPLLLVDKNSVPAETKKAVADLGIEEIIVIGGDNAVSKGVYNELGAHERYAGQSRIETSLDVAEKAFAEAKDFSIVGYLKLADAVGAAVNGNPIIYVKGNISDVKDYLTGAAAPASRFTIFGGTLAVSDTVENELKELLK
jgi:putative cell wall-binding protein